VAKNKTHALSILIITDWSDEPWNGVHMTTDKDWERWGASDPYFGVYSREEYRLLALNDQSRARFFATGEEHIDRIWQDIRKHADDSFSPASALDFGCGVGRLLIPLARRCKQVVGVDISPSMLTLARQNCDDEGLTNVALAGSDDKLSCVSGEFDLVHSHIVLQHIPWSRGRAILQSLAGRVAPGGIFAVQFYSTCTAPKLVRWIVRLRYRVPPLNWLRNLVRSRPVFEPAMQLHVYDLDTIVKDLEMRGFLCRQTHETWGEFRSTQLYATRPGDDAGRWSEIDVEQQPARPIKNGLFQAP